MIRVFLIFMAFLSFCMAFAQNEKIASQPTLLDLSWCTDYAKTDRDNYYRSKPISPAIALFNDISQVLGLGDVLTYDTTQQELVYYLNGENIPDPFFDMQGQYKDWDQQMRQHGPSLLLEYLPHNRLNAYWPTGQNTGILIHLGADKSSARIDLEVYETLRFLPNGRYQRRNCDGTLIRQGTYQTIDTTYTIQEEGIDRNTYETKTITTEVNHHTTKTGTWKYFQDDGSLLLEEQYPGGADWSKATDYLCITEKQTFRDLNRNLANPFMIFNTFCHWFDLDHWIAEDQLAGRKQYYYNGHPIPAPVVTAQRNEIEQVELVVPDATIVIRTKTNDHAALGKLENQLKLSFSASITRENGQGEMLRWSDNKLIRMQTVDGGKSGLYQELHCNGTYLLKGQYATIDAPRRDTVVLVSPNTYEEKTTVVELQKAEIPCGVWEYYDAEGNLLRTENKGDCK